MQLKHDPSVGYKLSETEIFTLDGKKVSFLGLWKEKPLLLITASLSCPFSRNSLKLGNKFSEKVSDQVSIAIVYVIDAHPKGNDSPYSGDEWIPRENFRDNILIPQPKTQSERAGRAEQLQVLLGLTTTLLVDNMNNLNWQALGRYPNAAVLIDTTGKVIYKQKRFKAKPMFKILQEQLGNL